MKMAFSMKMPFKFQITKTGSNLTANKKAPLRRVFLPRSNQITFHRDHSLTLVNILQTCLLIHRLLVITVGP